MRRTNYLFTVNKDYSEAARSYENILEKFPNSRYSYLARYRLAEAYFALEDYEKAAAEFEKVVASFASVRYTRRDAFRDAYFKLGYCQFLLEDFVGAARTYKTLLGLLDYENTEEALKAWKRLGWAYYQQGLYDEAAAEYRAFLSRYPEQDVDGSVRVSLGRTLLQRFDHEQARAEFERVIGERPMTEMARWSRYLICESYLTEAAGLEEAKRAPLLEEALTQAEAIRRDYPDEDRVLSILGRLYFELGDYKRAVRELEYYKYSTRNTKPSAEHQLRLAEAYYRLEDYPNAILNFEQIDLADLSRDEAARALYLQAESERLGQQLPESIETYNKMIEQYPTSPLKELAEGRVEEVTWNLSKGLGTASP
jgi:tetratricopeptide (TPR) repeat protein